MVATGCLVASSVMFADRSKKSPFMSSDSCFPDAETKVPIDLEEPSENLNHVRVSRELNPRQMMYTVGSRELAIPMAVPATVTYLPTTSKICFSCGSSA
jgi:hypothetical protein